MGSMWVGDKSHVVFARRGEPYVLWQAWGVKLCSLGPVTVSQRVIITAAVEFLRLGIIS